MRSYCDQINYTILKDMLRIVCLVSGLKIAVSLRLEILFKPIPCYIQPSLLKWCFESQYIVLLQLFHLFAHLSANRRSGQTLYLSKINPIKIPHCENTPRQQNPTF